MITRKVHLALRHATRFFRRRRLIASLSGDERELVRSVRQRKLTYLSQEKLATLICVCREIEQMQVPGSFIETGCALGGSTVVIGKSKSPSRDFHVYDVFGQIPPPSERDPQEVHNRFEKIEAGDSKGISGDPYYGYRDDLYEVVQQNLRSFDLDPEAANISLVKGLIGDTLVVQSPVALAHIDVDWFDPVMISLQRIFPHLSPGGQIILDDYHYWGGCRTAVDEYLKTVAGQFSFDTSGDSVRIIRNG